MTYSFALYDFEKAFDRVDWTILLQILKGLGVDWRDRRLIANLYLNQKSVVKVMQEYSEDSEEESDKAVAYRNVI